VADDPPGIPDKPYAAAVGVGELRQSQNRVVQAISVNMALFSKALCVATFC
jgi:hypothetical protein